MKSDFWNFRGLVQNSFSNFTEFPLLLFSRTSVSEILKAWFRVAFLTQESSLFCCFLRLPSLFQSFCFPSALWFASLLSCLYWAYSVQFLLHSSNFSVVQSPFPKGRKLENPLCTHPLLDSVAIAKWVHGALSLFLSSFFCTDPDSRLTGVYPHWPVFWGL